MKMEEKGKDEFIYKRGDEAKDLYFIKSGKVEIYKNEKL